MQSLCDELRIEIFKLIDKPISLSLSDRKWNEISRDPHARAEWLIYKYGRAHALFHAVRLGDGFITEEIVQTLLARNAIVSRYFIQRLIMQFGNHDERLIELKIEYNSNQIDSNRIRAFQKKLKSPWASNISLPVFVKLLNEGYNLLGECNIASKGNDMELFHFLSAGPLVINRAPEKLFQNLDEIKDLIINKKFIPFPPRKKPTYEDTIEYTELIQARAYEDYPPKDGCENSRQLNLIARAILIHPELVTLWNNIGYHEICSDVNELVMQGALLILFPPTPPNDWVIPSIDNVVNRLRQLIDLGFQLTDIVMEESIYLFEHRLDEFGDLLMVSFQFVHNKSRSDIARACLVQAIRLERNHRKIDLLEFLIDRIDRPEEALINSLEYYEVGFKFDVNSIKSIRKIRSLSVHSNVYYWILKKYGPDSEITQKCFEDIIESRIWIDLKLQETPDRNIPEKITNCAFNSTCSVYLEFCNEKVPFKSYYLQYLQLANNEEIIKPFFGVYLSIVFGLSLSYKLPFDINYEFGRPEIPEIKLISNIRNNKRKFEETNNDQLNNNIMKEWIGLLERINYSNFDASENFKNYLRNFWGRITSSQIQSLDNNDNDVAERSTEIISKRTRQ